MIEIWWKKMIFTTKEQMPTQRPIFIQDNLLVCGFALVWLSLSVWASYATQQSLAWVLLVSVFVPFMFWCAMIGFVVYVHHTHVKVSWHDDRSAWSKAQPFVSTTVHLTFPFNIGSLLHHIMEHTAHHVDMSIPLYKLKSAQEKLENLLPERIIIQPFSWSWYFETAKNCKLYDFKHRCWTDYQGNFTSVATPIPV
jgi:omega-6 fatty acid desaturase (delta-12 desaturase)